MPADFRLHWVVIEEPDKVTGADGKIYFWIRELDQAGLAEGAPRAYQIPWDEDTAEAAQDALEETRGWPALKWPNEPTNHQPRSHFPRSNRAVSPRRIGFPVGNRPDSSLFAYRHRRCRQSQFRVESINRFGDG